MRKPRNMDGRCPVCWDHVHGEWRDGTEIKCDYCGVMLVAVAVLNKTGDTRWRFDRAYDEPKAKRRRTR